MSHMNTQAETERVQCTTVDLLPSGFSCRGSDLIIGDSCTVLGQRYMTAQSISKLTSTMSPYHYHEYLCHSALSTFSLAITQKM